MIIAQQKRQENIIEYILYMRQIADIIRAFDFNINKINESVISKFKVNENKRAEIKDWYAKKTMDLINEKKEQGGDLFEIEQLISDLNELHLSLLNDSEEYKHAELYRWAQPNIEEFRKLSNQNSANDIKICIDALHSLMLLKLKNRSISEDTMQAMQTFSNLLAHLAMRFKKQEIGLH